MGTAGDDGVIGSGFADSGSYCGLDGLPSGGIVLFGLVHDLEEDAFGVEVGEVGGEGGPESAELLYGVIVVEEGSFIAALGMDVDDDGEVVVEDGLNGLVQLRDEGGGVGWVVEPGQEWIGVDAETDVIEA